MYLLIFLTLSVLMRIHCKEDQIEDVEIGMSTEKIIARYGYHWEKHKVTSQDGYITANYRIPHAKNKQRATKGPVFLMHGPLQSSTDWFFVSAERALPFLLAEKGFDVWIGNARGTKDSMRHTSLDHHSLEYWDFSYHEMGVYDLPVTFDYILNTTKWSHLVYVGFSIGTTMFYACLSTLPQYNSKISKMASFGAIPKTKMAPAVWQDLPDFVLMNVINYLNNGRIFPFSDLMQSIYKLPCGLQLTETYCDGYSPKFFGYEGNNYNKTTIARAIERTPQSMSMKLFVHLLQSIRSRLFRRFDYGQIRNRKIYDQSTPPGYETHFILVPIFGLCSYGDKVTTFDDCTTTLSAMGNRINSDEEATVEDPNFSHFDYMLHDNVTKLVYDRVIAHLED